MSSGWVSSQGRGSRRKHASFILGLLGGHGECISFSVSDGCVFAAFESEVLGSGQGTAETLLCERSLREPSLSQAWSLSAWG